MRTSRVALVVALGVLLSGDPRMSAVRDPRSAARIPDAGEAAQVPAAANSFNDSHFHLTNYIQEGTDIRAFMDIMGDKIGRSTLFGIPLQQTWAYENSGEFAPTYYLQSDAPLYYYSFTDAYIAMAYRSLSPQQHFLPPPELEQ